MPKQAYDPPIEVSDVDGSFEVLEAALLELAGVLLAKLLPER